MNLRIRCFGIVREALGVPVMELEIPEGINTLTLKQYLQDHYPRLQGLPPYFLAVNNEYSSDLQILKGGDEVAIIPPVSGG